MVFARPQWRLRSLIEVGKLPIALASAFSSVPGFFLHGVEWDAGLIGAFVSVLFGTMVLAFGAGALNNVQDMRLDARSERTRRRALPSGAMHGTTALLLSLSLLVVGLAVLALGAGETAALLGLAAVVTYNGIYTPLKRVTSLALWPGTVVGAIPPLMGNAAAGGSWEDPAIYWLALFYVIWQVPHFLLILLKHGTNYADSGIPTLLDHFSERSLARIIFLWIVAVIVAAQLSVLFLPRSGIVTSLVLLIAGIWLLRASIRLLQSSSQSAAARTAFMRINLFSLVVGLVVSVQA